MAFDQPSTDGTSYSVSVLSATTLEQQVKFEGTIDQGFDYLKTLAHDIQCRIDLVENIGLHLTVVDFKIYEVTHDFVKQMNAIKAKKDAMLENADVERGSVISQLNVIDNEIQMMETHHEERLFDYNKEKLDQQERLEECVITLDHEFKRLQTIYYNLQKEIEEDKAIRPDDFATRYNHRVEKMNHFIAHFGKLHMSGWKTINSETQLAQLLDERGLVVTKSGMLYTKSGNLLSFDNAQEQGYFDNLDIPLERIFGISTPFLEKDADPSTTNLSRSTSKASTTSSGMSHEDVKYLKTVVGKPLTLALAEITTKQPKDPIHYLGHYLFKYRYNQEIEQMQKEEVEALAEERRALSKKRWDMFVFEEAKAAVVDMVLRAEAESIQNELKRIEEEAAALEAEEAEHDADEAKDKFM